MMRDLDPRLQALYDRGEEVYSFSRLETYHTCPFSFYERYIKHVKDRPNVYTSLGLTCHDVLQRYIEDGQDMSLEGKINETLSDLDLLGISFPKSRDGQDTIRDHWVENMTLFARNFKVPEGKFETEKFVLFTTGDIHVQGYIDLLRHNEDGTVTILDWKTSSMYKGDDIKKHSRQLTTYAIACEQEGMRVRDVGWIFLKYADFEKKYKNGSRRSFTKEWRKLPENAIGPKVSLVTYPYTEETKEECCDYIKETVAEIRSCGDIKGNYPPCDVEKESYYCNNLCGAREVCPYLKEFNKDFVKDGDDLF